MVIVRTKITYTVNYVKVNGCVSLILQEDGRRDVVISYK